jgi:hypothetical protein
LLNGQPINDTKEAPHIGLLQSDTIAKTMEINVKQNIKKARRTTYSLMASGLHGQVDNVPVLHILLQCQLTLGLPSH